MRRTIITATVAALSLSLVGVALAASFTQSSAITLTAKKSGKSTGFDASVHSTFPGGTKPKVAKKLIVTFPSGTRFNFGKFPACKLSDSKIMGGTSCPRTSQIGGGSAKAVAWPLGLNVNAGVKAYISGSTSMVVVATATSPIKQTIVIRESIAGSKLAIPIPSPTTLGNQVILTALTLNVPAKRSGTKMLAVSGTCVSGKFVVKSDFTYTDGSTVHLTTSSACH